MYGRDFPGGPVVKIFPSNAGNGLDPWPKKQNIKNKQKKTPRSNIVTNSIKALKMVHILKNLKKKMYGIEL